MEQDHHSVREQPQVTATAEGSRLYFVRLARKGQLIHAYCECAYFDTEGPCKHLWATILAAESKNYLLGFNGILQMEMDYREDLEEFDLDPEFKRKVSPPAPRVYQWREIISRLPPEMAATAQRETWRSGREIYYLIDAATSGSNLAGIQLEVNYRERKQTGEWGKLKNTRIPRTASAGFRSLGSRNTDRAGRCSGRLRLSVRFPPSGFPAEAHNSRFPAAQDVRHRAVSVTRQQPDAL